MPAHVVPDVIKSRWGGGRHIAAAIWVVWSRNKMATASTAVLTALVALALGNLQMIDALINPCVTVDHGNTKILGLGKWTYKLDEVKIPKHFNKFGINIPSKEACPTPVGVSMTVCDFAPKDLWVPPQVTYTSLDVAFATLNYNEDPNLDDLLQVTVYCVGVPYFHHDKPVVTVHRLFD